jgi:hypothetical protein
MATTNITVRHRPNRIGFLVRPDHLSDLEQAAGICTLLWGGLRNPIIPVAKDDATADQLLKEFQVDVIFPVTESDPIKQFAERYPYLRNPQLSAREIFQEDWHTKKKKIAYLDVLNTVERYWEREFKHAPAERDSNCRLVAWEESDRLKELFVLSFGAYPTNLNLKHDFREGFLKGLRAKEVTIGVSGNVDAEIADAITPMRLTGIDLQGFQGSFRTWEGGVYFGDAKNFADLTTFWNLRAAGGAVEFASLPDLARLEHFVKAHLKRLDDQPNSHPNIESHIAICYRDHHDQVIAAIQNFPTKKRILLCQCGDSVGGDLIAKPAMFCFDWDFSVGFVESENGRYTVTLPLPDKRFLVHSERSVDDQSMAVSIEPHSNFGYSDHTLSPPFVPELSEAYSRKISFDPWRVRSEEEGIGVFTRADDKTLQLHPIANGEVVEALLDRAGLKVGASAGGRLADRLLERLNGLEGTRVFKIRGVRQLVASLTSQTAIGRGDATKAIWNSGQFKEHERLHIEQRDTPTLGTDSTFDFLLRKDFFRAGLELICDHCGLESWLSLRQIDDDWVCEYCGHKNTTSLHIRNRGDWRFRKSGLLAKDNNQEGAIPVLLSLLVLERVLGHDGTLRMTLANVIEGIPKCEIDFMSIRHRAGEIEWALGEAKSAGGKIEADDVAHMKAVADKLKGIGVNPYLVFSKTADSFAAEEIELFRAAKKEGYSVILFTNKEIEPYNPYYESDDSDQLPHKYVHSFNEMVQNSEYRYFRPTPEAASANQT